jgi:predicted nucleotidyltransferase
MTIPKLLKELKFLVLEAQKYDSAEKFAGTLGIPEKDIVWIQVFGSSVEGKPNPNDIDIFVAVKEGSMKFKRIGGPYHPIVKDVGKLRYFIMPESEAEDFLNAMLYIGRKDPDRGYQGKTVAIKSLRDFYVQAKNISFLT